MIEIRRGDEICAIEGGWYQARWHFSSDQYRDPDHDSVGAMRVVNDDGLVPGAVWPLHPHRDLEGITYVVEGTFGHEDNVGGAFGPLPAGSVERMTLGGGARLVVLDAGHGAAGHRGVAGWWRDSDRRVATIPLPWPRSVRTSPEPGALSRSCSVASP